MDSLSKKIQNLGIHDIRNAARFAQNVIVQYEPYQIDVRRATNTDAWGPTTKHLEKVMRNRFQVPMYLVTEYILKRLIDHIATKPKNLYEKARKEYVNYGSEWRVVLKCLTVIEYLLLNVNDGDELNQIKSCLLTHKHILTREVLNFKIRFSNDGKMEVHERSIRKKGEKILQMLDDSRFLKEERSANKKNSIKIRQQHETYNSMNTYTNNNAVVVDDDDDDDDEFSNYEMGSSNSYASENGNNRRHNALEEQRRQRREVLRERIKNSELERKKQQKQEDQETSVPDLIDLDFNEPSQSKIDNNDEDDDEFGDFQSDSSPNPVSTTQQANNTALDDLLDFGNHSTKTSSIGTTTTTTTTTNKDKDVFADLFNNSKSLI